MKKRVIALVLAVISVIMCLGLAACGDKETSDKETLIMGFDPSFPPMGFQENGEYVGFDVDLAKEVTKRLGMELKLQPIDWNAKDSELKTGAIDVIWNGFTMQGRENDYEWTTPYMKNNQIVVVNKDAPYNTLADLKGKKVALQKDSTAENALNSATEFKASLAGVIPTKDNLGALNELKTGMVDAVVMDEVVAAYNIAQQGGNYKILEGSLSAEDYGIGFLKGNTELRDKVQKTLEEMNEDGTLAEISNKWFGKDVTVIGK